MTRLPRILLNAATAVSVVLCVATAVLWVRSGVPRSVLTWAAGRRSTCVGADDGYLLITSASPWADAARARRAAALLSEGPVGFDDPAVADVIATLNTRHDEMADDRLAWLAGAIYVDVPAGPRSWGISLGRGLARLAARDAQGRVSLEAPVPLTRGAVPCWIGVGAFGLLPAAATGRAFVAHVRRRRRRATRRCSSCGYDLRATPERCPECGRSRRRRLFG